jgi:hypothetical protein
MYLRQLYSHSRLLYSLVILFICAQLFVILIWGIVISPFYNYGMYSEVMDIKKDYQIFEVEVNGNRLQGQAFSPQQWDNIILPLQFYSNIQQSNRLYETDIKRLLQKMQISSNEADFVSSCNYPQFEKWYIQHLQAITKQKILAIKINLRQYQYQSNMLQPTSSALSLAQLCR